jgi:hypothetical protein
MFAKQKVDPVLWVKMKLFGRMLDEAWIEGYDKGTEDSQRNLKSKIRSEFVKNGLEDFQSDELKLGYSYAKGLVTDVLEGKR